MISSTFVSGKGPWYAFDPRAKLLLVVLLCIEVFLPAPLWGIYLLFAVTFAFLFHALGLKMAFSPFKAIGLIILIMVLFIPFTHRTGKPLLVIGETVIATQDSLLQFATHTGRFLTITYLTTLFVWTTKMHDILLTFRWFRLPYSAALVITLTFRFIPFIAETFTRIQEAHSLRQSEHSQSKGWNALFDILPTISCTLIFALKSIPHLAMSLEHRGFGSSVKRSSYRRLPGNVSLFTHLVICGMIATTFALLLLL